MIGTMAHEDLVQMLDDLEYRVRDLDLVRFVESEVDERVRVAITHIAILSSVDRHEVLSRVEPTLFSDFAKRRCVLARRTSRSLYALEAVAGCLVAPVRNPLSWRRDLTYALMVLVRLGGDVETARHEVERMSDEQLEDVFDEIAASLERVAAPESIGRLEVRTSFGEGLIVMDQPGHETDSVPSWIQAGLDNSGRILPGVSPVFGEGVLGIGPSLDAQDHVDVRDLDAVVDAAARLSDGFEANDLGECCQMEIIQVPETLLVGLEAGASRRIGRAAHVLVSDIPDADDGHEAMDEGFEFFVMALDSEDADLVIDAVDASVDGDDALVAIGANGLLVLIAAMPFDEEPDLTQARTSALEVLSSLS